MCVSNRKAIESHPGRCGKWNAVSKLDMKSNLASRMQNQKKIQKKSRKN